MSFRLTDAQYAKWGDSLRKQQANASELNDALEKGTALINARSTNINTAERQISGSENAIQKLNPV